MKANTPKKIRTKPEIGASGTTNFQGNIDTEEYVSKLQGSTLYKTMDQMRWSDASVQAALLMCELPIRSAEWDIEAASDSAQDVEIAEFIKGNLFKGLTLNWEETLRQILLMLPYGVMVFEKVYQIDEMGLVGWRKWAPRLPRTIIKWHVDKNGELESIEQRAYKNDKFLTITIDTQKLLIFNHRREGDNYLGTSILRQAYKHWFFRDKYYKIDAVAQERSGIGIPVITLPDSFTDDDYEDAEKLGKNLRGHERAYIIKKTGWEVEMLDMHSSGLKDPQKMLDHHTREILKSVLAHFIDLGSSSAGSYALAKDQSKMFLVGLDAMAKGIEDIINREIETLVDYNWNVEEYPTLTHSDLGIKDVKEISDALQSLVMVGTITPDDKLEDYMRKALKLPERDQAEQEVDRDKDEKSDEEKKAEQEGDNEDEIKKAKEQKYFRPLTKCEQSVKFDEIRDFMDTSESELRRSLNSIIEKERPRLIEKFRDAIERMDFATLKRISWELKPQYIQVFRENIQKLFEYGKLKAGYEIAKPAPATTPDQKQSMNKEALYLANFHENKMLEDLKNKAAFAMMDKEAPVADVLKEVEHGIDVFKNRNISASASLTTSSEINKGRIYTFNKFNNDIYGYQWSAILDKRTCNYCSSMDGRTIGVRAKEFSDYKPGAVHFGCRCIWVAIMREEENPPPITGISKLLRPQSQVPAWDFTDLQFPIVGNKKIPLGVYE